MPFRIAARLTCLALAAAALLAAARPAAAFEGRNGLLVYEGRASADHQLVLRDAHGDDPQVLRTDGRPRDPSVSAAGVRIAYAAKGQIWVMQADGSAPRQVTGSYYPSNGDPAWSPAGDALVFTEGPRGGRDVFTVGADGNGLTRLTHRAADEYQPVWSSRNHIAYVRHTGRGDGDLWAVDPDGSHARRLTHGRKDDRDPAWSPDGRRIAFTRNTPHGRTIFVANRLGHHVRRLRKLPRGARAPVWSPTGRWIAFAMGRRGHRAIYRMRSNGHRLRRVVSGSTNARAIDWQPRPGDPSIAAAGDIACDPTSPQFVDGYGTPSACHQRSTSDEMLRMDLAGVLMLGDAQYEDNTLAKFMRSFDATWGRLKGLMHPVIGNHELWTPGGTGYWDYFNGPGAPNGPAGARGDGWYSFDVGSWHLVALDSDCDVVSCAAGGAQERWLRADLATHPARCTLAFMHHPLVSSGSGSEGSTPAVHDLWQALYDGGADVILAGHDHAYERFMPLNPEAQGDPLRGMREFVVGTGGKSHQVAASPRPGSEVRDSTSFGVLRLTLHPDGYDWAFVPDGPGGFTDAGSGACH